MMQTLPCHYDKRAAEGPVVGLIVLQSDEVLEKELRAWLPGHIELLHTRIANDSHVSSDTLRAMETELPCAVDLLPKGVDYSAIAYGCTSASTLIGEARVCELVNQWLPRVPVTNPMSALKAQLQSLGITRIALLAPYSQVVSSSIVDHLNASSIEVVQSATFEQTDDAQVARIDATSVFDAMLELGRDTRAEAIFGSCTNLRSLSFLDEACQTIGKPVITSNSALAWHIEQLVSNNW